jgi:hypothetical protein
MVKKADIVKHKGSLSTQVGIVDKIFMFRQEEHAIIRWIKPVAMSNRKTYVKTKALETLRTAAEAAQRGRKKRVEGLDESSESHDVKIVREEE